MQLGRDTQQLRRGGVLVCVVEIAVEQADRDRLDALADEGRGGRGDFVFGQWRFLAAAWVDASTDRLAQVAWHQHRLVRRAMVPWVGPQAAADFEAVTKALADQAGDPGPFAFQQGIRRDGGTMHELAATREQFGLGHGVGRGGCIQRAHHTCGGILRIGSDLVNCHRAGRGRQDKVGERAADIDADAKLRAGCGHRAFLGRPAPASPARLAATVAAAARTWRPSACSLACVTR